MAPVRCRAAADATRRRRSSAGGHKDEERAPRPATAPSASRYPALPRQPRPGSNRLGRRTIWPPSPAACSRGGEMDEAVGAIDRLRQRRRRPPRPRPIPRSRRSYRQPFSTGAAAKGRHASLSTRSAIRGTTPPSVQLPVGGPDSLTLGASVSKAQAPHARSCRSATAPQSCAPHGAPWCGRGRQIVGRFPAASAGSASWRGTSPPGAA